MSVATETSRFWCYKITNGRAKRGQADPMNKLNLGLIILGSGIVGGWLLLARIEVSSNGASGDETRLILRHVPRVVPPGRRLQNDRISRRRIDACVAKLNTVSPDGLPPLAHLLLVRRFSKHDPQSLFELVFSGPQLRQRWGIDLVGATRFGAEYLPGNRLCLSGEAHRGQMLEALAQAGVPVDQPISLPSGEQRCVKDLVAAYAIDMSYEQELPWITSALVRYLEPGCPWKNKFGQPVTFDLLCEKLLDESSRPQQCFGAHHMKAMALLASADSSNQLLSIQNRKRAIERLQREAATLSKCQGSEGDLAPPATGTNAPDRGLNSLPRRISYTGHSLEWMALAPPEVIIDAEGLGMACDFMVDKILAASSESIRQNLCPYSHAVAALQFLQPDGRD
jgi:hypothetical protein